MRKSVLHGDPGYDPVAWSYMVLLNGVELKGCFTADEELGEAWVYILDKDDNIEGGSHKILHGDVKIVKPQAAEDRDEQTYLSVKSEI